MTRIETKVMVAGLLAVVFAIHCNDSNGPSSIAVTAVSPATGSMAGGTSITITGTNFINVTSVTVGGNELGSRTVVSPTEITGTTPAASSAGAKDVVVTSSSQGSSTCSGCFTYEAGAVTVMAVSPPSGRVAGGTSVTITGTNFINVTSVTVGGTELGNRTVVSPTEITGTTPAASSSGAKDVVVTSSSQGSSTCSGCFSYESADVIAAVLAAGQWNTCALTSSGAAYCWGNGRATPVAVAGGLSFSALATSGAHTCALTTSGAAYCWGSNAAGQLGDGSTTSSATPVAVVGGHNFIALSVGGGGYGYAHTCGLTSVGAAYCWGYNDSGQLGDGSTTNSATPVAVVGGHNFIALTAGGNSYYGTIHTCGVTSSGAAYCWGSNADGELGDGSTTSSATPVAVAGGLSFGAVAAGDAHTCGLTNSGTAYCWGGNWVGQLGDGSTINNRLTPVPVAGGLSFSALGAGYDDTCGLTSSGAAYCWGFNYYGELGNGPGGGPDSCWVAFGFNGYHPCSTNPVAVVGGLSFNALAVGGFHTCARTSAEAAVYCWGRNDNGQLGDGQNWSAPAPVVGDLSFSALTAAIYHTCGLTSAGAAYCWGWNEYGQLGNGSTTSSATPVAVPGGLSFSALDAGFSHTCGLTSAGAAYCWGYNAYGQLGDGSTTNSATPVVVAGGLSFRSLGAGYYHTCGLTSAGAAYCWGDNRFGQLGEGSTTGPESCSGYACSMAPVAVAGGLTFSALGAGYDHTCGLTNAGAAYCWGFNYYGQLGDGSTTSSTTPVAVAGGLSFGAVAAGRAHTCGLTNAATVYCWGQGFPSTPVAVSRGLSFTTLGARNNRTCGLTSSGALYCLYGWQAPVAEAEGWSFIALAVGSSHTCGLTSSQAAYCWGLNNYGQLGRGVFDYSPVPVAVAPFGTSGSASVTVMPAGSMRLSEPFFGERCTPPVPGRQPRTERSERDPRCRARP